jgi:hypothetical protein
MYLLTHFYVTRECTPLWCILHPSEHLGARSIGQDLKAN